MAVVRRVEEKLAPVAEETLVKGILEAVVLRGRRGIKTGFGGLVHAAISRRRSHIRNPTLYALWIVSARRHSSLGHTPDMSRPPCARTPDPVEVTVAVHVLHLVGRQVAADLHRLRDEQRPREDGAEADWRQQDHRGEAVFDNIPGERRWRRGRRTKGRAVSHRNDRSFGRECSVAVNGRTVRLPSISVAVRL